MFHSLLEVKAEDHEDAEERLVLVREGSIIVSFRVPEAP